MPEDHVMERSKQGSIGEGKSDEYAQAGFFFRHNFAKAVMTRLLGTKMMEPYYDQKILKTQYTAIRGRTAAEAKRGYDYPLFPERFIAQRESLSTITGIAVCDLWMNRRFAKIARASTNELMQYFEMLRPRTMTAIVASNNRTGNLPREPHDTLSTMMPSVAASEQQGDFVRSATSQSATDHSIISATAKTPHVKNFRQVVRSTQRREVQISGMEELFCDVRETCDQRLALISPPSTTTVARLWTPCILICCLRNLRRLIRRMH